MPRPRILVADDNPVSLRFFADALDALGFDGTLAPDGARAIAEADARAFDALLLDVHMPVHGGVDVLAHVRAGGGPSREAIAMATSAETNVETIAALRAAGFAEVLAKPIGVDALRVALMQHLPTTLDAPDAALDDAQALSAAGGDTAIVAALRGLFATELDALPAEIEALAMRSDIAGLRDRLHRLDASAGFCGAPTLQAAISRLRRSLDGAHWPAGPLDGFLATCARVRDALGASGAPESHG